MALSADLACLHAVHAPLDWLRTHATSPLPDAGLLAACCGLPLPPPAAVMPSSTSLLRLFS